MTGPMSKGERDDLLSLVKKRERVLKKAAEQREAEMVAEFEAQVSAIHGWDTDDVFDKVKTMAEEEIKALNVKVAARCEELGIPEEFRPSLNLYWDSRREAAYPARRAELRRKAKTHAAQVRAEAETKIEVLSLQAQTDLLSTGLTSDAAQTFLSGLADIKALMPQVTADQAREVVKQIARKRDDTLQ